MVTFRNNNNNSGNINNNPIPSQLPGVPNILSLLQPASPLTTSQNAQNLQGTRSEYRFTCIDARGNGREFQKRFRTDS